MSKDPYRHINAALEPQTAAGTMALYLREKFKEKIDVGSGIVQLEEENPICALQLVFGSELRHVCMFISEDGTVSQMVVDQGPKVPTTVFIPQKETPDQLSEEFLTLILQNLFPSIEGRL